MNTVVRKIIEIDEERCDGCGLCVLDCAEGAIQIIDGVAKIVKDEYCDGLGACLGACPQDALKIIEREAPEFDEEAAMEWVRERDAKEAAAKEEAPKSSPCGCMGSQVKSMKTVEIQVPGNKVSGPGHWPLKIRLVPPTAPYLKNADVLVAADCAAAASPIFHSEFAAGKVVLIGCPKFDDTQEFVRKLADIIRNSGIRSIGVLRMEVPCCTGLSKALADAIKLSGVDIDATETIMTCGGGRAEKGMFG